MSISNLMEWVSDVTLDNIPPTKNFNLYANTQWEESIEFNDTTNEDDPQPIDISGYTFTLTIKNNISSISTAKVLTVGSGLTVSGTGNNILTISTLINIAAGQYVYDLIGVSSTKPKAYLRGKIKVEHNV